MRVYFVRHGESELNVKDLHQHPEDPLSRTGIKQAKALAERFTKIPIDKILSSDYIRAKRTAEYIAEATRKPIELTKLLRERKRPSELIGKPFKSSETRKTYRLLYNHSHDPNWHYSDEENFYDAVKRAEHFVEFVENQKEKNIVVVSHGAMIKFIVAVMMVERDKFLLTPELFNRLYYFYRASNTGITICEKRTLDFVSDKVETHIRRRWHLVTWNDHAHLG